MKKLIFTCLAAAALSMTSCGGNSTNNSEGNDSTVEVAADAVAGADSIAAKMEECIKNSDADAINKLQEDAANVIKGLYAKGDSVAAEAYKSKILAFIRDNQTKLNELKVTDLVSKVANAPADVDAAAKAGADAVKADAAHAATEVKNAAEASANKAVNDAKDKANAKVNEATQKANDKVNEATQKANNKVNEAANKAANDVKKGLGL